MSRKEQEPSNYRIPEAIAGDPLDMNGPLWYVGALERDGGFEVTAPRLPDDYVRPDYPKPAPPKYPRGSAAALSEALRNIKPIVPRPWVPRGTIPEPTTGN